MNFTIDIQEDFQTNSSIRNYITRNKHHFIDQMPTYPFQKGTFHARIKIFNNFPPSVKILNNDKANFPVALRKYLISLYGLSFICLNVIYNTVV